MSYIQSAGGSPLKSERFTSTGTWTRPSTTDAVYVVLVGAGGGGEDAAAHACGGGGGQIVTRYCNVNGNVTVTIGAAGAAGVSGVGGNGGDSTFAGVTTITADGGGGGGANLSGSGIGGGFLNSGTDHCMPLSASDGEKLGTGSSGGAYGGMSREAREGFSCSGYGKNGSFATHGGGGGSLGDGGDGHATDATTSPPAANSGGGGGAANGTAAAGGTGYCEVYWSE